MLFLSLPPHLPQCYLLPPGRDKQDQLQGFREGQWTFFKGGISKQATYSDYLRFVTRLGRPHQKSDALWKLRKLTLPRVEPRFKFHFRTFDRDTHWPPDTVPPSPEASSAACLNADVTREVRASTAQWTALSFWKHPRHDRSVCVCVWSSSTLHSMNVVLWVGEGAGALRASSASRQPTSWNPLVEIYLALCVNNLITNNKCPSS